MKVVRVHYAPREKLPMHDHTERAAAYVYLNDRGPVIFRHDYAAVTRPATMTGSFRLYRAIKEVHEVENPNDVPSDFLRVELKTRPVEEDKLYGRFHRPADSDGQGLEEVQFDNGQLRVTRYLMAPGEKLEATANAEPALLVALTTGRLKTRNGPVLEEVAVEPGHSRWLRGARDRASRMSARRPSSCCASDLKTEPLAPARPLPGSG